MGAQTAAPHRADTEGLLGVGLIWGRVWGWRLCQSHREGGFSPSLSLEASAATGLEPFLVSNTLPGPQSISKPSHLEDAGEQSDCKGGTEKD